VPITISVPKENTMGVLLADNRQLQNRTMVVFTTTDEFTEFVRRNSVSAAFLSRQVLWDNLSK
jgi:hypothetical protein